MIYKKNILVPSWGKDSVAEIEIKRYIKDIESLMITAGLIYSNVNDNLDTENIVLPSVDVKTSGYYYIEKKLQFDLNDSLQAVNPLRIKFNFGFYRRQGGDSAAKYPVVLYFTMEVYSILLNKSVTLVAFAPETTDVPYLNDNSNSRGGWTHKLYSGGGESFVINRDGFLTININTLSMEYYNSTIGYDSSFFWLIIDRNNDGANVIGFNGSMVCYNMSKTLEPYNDITRLHYVATDNVFVDGKMPVFPTHTVDDIGENKQSSNVVLTNYKTIACGGEVDINVGAIKTRFKAMSGKNSTFFRGSGRVLVRIE